MVQKWKAGNHFQYHFKTTNDAFTRKFFAP